MSIRSVTIQPASMKKNAKSLARLETEVARHTIGIAMRIKIKPMKCLLVILIEKEVRGCHSQTAGTYTLENLDSLGAVITAKLGIAP